MIEILESQEIINKNKGKVKPLAYYINKERFKLSNLMEDESYERFNK